MKVKVKEFVNKLKHSEDFNYEKFHLDPKELEEILSEFAHYCCEEQKKVCFNNAYCSLEHPDDENDLEESDYIVNKDSILNCKNVVDE